MKKNVKGVNLLKTKSWARKKNQNGLEKLGNVATRHVLAYIVAKLNYTIKRERR